METPKAAHTIGDAVHVKFYFKDDRCLMAHYGVVTGAHLIHGSLFPDRVLYDVSLEQADGPNIKIQDLPAWFVLAGGPKEPEMEETTVGEMRASSANPE